MNVVSTYLNHEGPVPYTPHYLHHLVIYFGYQRYWLKLKGAALKSNECRYDWITVQCPAWTGQRLPLFWNLGFRAYFQHIFKE